MITDLLQIASTLARLESGRPKQTSLRRAVSTSDYAVFHAIAERCAKTLAGEGSDWETYSLVYRALDVEAQMGLAPGLRELAKFF